jgi:hypothetical protein
VGHEEQTEVRAGYFDLSIVPCGSGLCTAGPGTSQHRDMEAKTVTGGLITGASDQPAVPGAVLLGGPAELAVGEAPRGMAAGPTAIGVARPPAELYRHLDEEPSGVAHLLADHRSFERMSLSGSLSTVVRGT